MKFHIHRHITGDTRKIKKFAWYPMYINGTIYWLEMVTICQHYDNGWVNDWIEWKENI